MRRRLTILACGAAIAAQSSAQPMPPKLSNGVITYTTSTGKQGFINVGRKCADLWVSPDQSVIAFIAIDKESGHSPDNRPVIEKSTIYIARQSDHFAPIRVRLRPIVINGRLWEVVRNPRISPDHRTMFFEIPYTITTSKVMSVAQPSTAYKTIGDATAYCVNWGGKRSGDLLLQRRHFSDDPSTGVVYRCYLRNQSGMETKIADECSNFQEFANRWSREQGGACQ